MNIEHDTGESEKVLEFAEPLDGSLLGVSINEEVKETFKCDIYSTNHTCRGI